MARDADALEFRRWALGFSPSVLKRRVTRQWEILAREFEKRVSLLFLERWRAGLFGEETDKDRQQYDDQFKKGFLQGTLMEELFFFASCSENLSEAVGVPVVCDRAPYEVPVDHAHLFDILPSVLRRNFNAARSGSDLTRLRTAIQLIRDGSSQDLVSAFTSVRPIMDRAIPLLLRATDGYGIHNEFVPHWIVFNVRMARYGVDGRDRQAACRSLESIGAALLPSQLVGKGPNKAGLTVDYRFIRENADSILRKKYNNPQLKAAALHKALPQFDRSLIGRFADVNPRSFALELLSARYALKPGYLWNLIKRGNLFMDITLHWRDALLSTKKSPLSANPQLAVTPSQIS